MPDIPFAQLLVVLAFILFPLINSLLRRMQRRFEEQARRRPPAQPAPRTYARAPLEVIASAEPTRAPHLPETPPPAQSQRRKKLLFKNRHELRRAMIVMTVLAPCRAVDAPVSADPRLPQ
jgi:hypothetical protein